MIQFNQRTAVVATLGATVAGVLGGDPHQAHGFALQGVFHLMAQIRLRFVEGHPHFQRLLAPGFGEQIDVWQVSQLQQNLRQWRRADALQVVRPWNQFRFDTDQGFAVEGDVENLVLITDLRNDNGIGEPL